MLVKAIKHSQHGELLYIEVIDPKLVLTVYSADVEREIAVGEELSEDDLSYLSSRDEYYRATKRALSILSHSDNTARSLVHKLVLKGFSKSAATEAAEYMTALGYINETSQLERIISREANEALLGPKKIFSRLIPKGYSASDIKSVMRRLSESGEVDFVKNLDILYEKRAAFSEEERAKLKHKYGY